MWYNAQKKRAVFVTILRAVEKLCFSTETVEKPTVFATEGFVRSRLMPIRFALTLAKP